MQCHSNKNTSKNHENTKKTALKATGAAKADDTFGLRYILDYPLLELGFGRGAGREDFKIQVWGMCLRWVLRIRRVFGVSTLTALPASIHLPTVCIVVNVKL